MGLTISLTFLRNGMQMTGNLGVASEMIGGPATLNWTMG